MQNGRLLWHSAIPVVVLCFLLSGCWHDDDDDTARRTPGRTQEPLFDLSGVWEIPGPVECSGNGVLSSTLQALENNGRGRARYSIEQNGNDLDIDLHDTFTGTESSFDGTFEFDQVRYEYEHVVLGVNVDVTGEGTAINRDEIEVDEYHEATLVFLPVTVHCFFVLEWQEELP